MYFGEKRLPPFLRAVVFEGFCFVFVSFVPKVFWFGPFERSKPLGVWFALVVPFGAEGFFGSDLLKGRSPLAFI